MVMTKQPHETNPGGKVFVGGSVRLVMRNYFSSHLPAAAGQMVRAAGEIEDHHDTTGPLAMFGLFVSIGDGLRFAITKPLFSF